MIYISVAIFRVHSAIWMPPIVPEGIALLLPIANPIEGLVGSLILKILVIGAILRSFHHPKDLTFEKIHLSPRNPNGAQNNSR